jgi:hypothetical protein
MLNILLTVFSAVVLQASANLFVQTPTDLKKQFGNQGEIKAKLGNFGFIQQGGSIMGNVIFPTFNNTDGCLEFN